MSTAYLGAVLQRSLTTVYRKCSFDNQYKATVILLIRLDAFLSSIPNELHIKEMVLKIRIHPHKSTEQHPSGLEN